MDCLNRHLLNSGTFCPDVDCRIPIEHLNGVPIEFKSMPVDPDFEAEMSIKLSYQYWRMMFRLGVGVVSLL